jgi:hypothetical protein
MRPALQIDPLLGGTDCQTGRRAGKQRHGERQKGPSAAAKKSPCGTKQNRQEAKKTKQKKNTIQRNQPQLRPPPCHDGGYSQRVPSRNRIWAWFCCIHRRANCAVRPPMHRSWLWLACRQALAALCYTLWHPGLLSPSAEGGLQGLSPCVSRPDKQNSRPCDWQCRAWLSLPPPPPTHYSSLHPDTTNPRVADPVGKPRPSSVMEGGVAGWLSLFSALIREGRAADAYYLHNTYLL